MGPPKAQVTSRASPSHLPQLTPRAQLSSPCTSCTVPPPLRPAFQGSASGHLRAPAQSLALLPPTVRTYQGSSELHGPPARTAGPDCAGLSSHLVRSLFSRSHFSHNSSIRSEEEMIALLLVQT